MDDATIREFAERVHNMSDDEICELIKDLEKIFLNKNNVDPEFLLLFEAAVGMKAIRTVTNKFSSKLKSLFDLDNEEA